MLDMATSWFYVIALVIMALCVLYTIPRTPQVQQRPRTVTSIVQIPRKWKPDDLAAAYYKFTASVNTKAVFHLWNDERVKETQRAKIELTSQDRRDVLEILRQLLPADKDGHYQRFVDFPPQQFDDNFKGLVYELPNREFLRYIVHGEYGNAPVHTLVNWLQANAKRCKIPWDRRLLKCYTEWDKLEQMLTPESGGVQVLRVLVTTVCMGSDVVLESPENFMRVPTRDASEFDSVAFA
jgi:hypothetical protein